MSETYFEHRCRQALGDAWVQRVADAFEQVAATHQDVELGSVRLAWMDGAIEVFTTQLERLVDQDGLPDDPDDAFWVQAARRFGLCSRGLGCDRDPSTRGIRTAGGG